MSEIDISNNTVLDYSYYFTYAVNDQFGVQSLSGYALPNSPLIFVPAIGDIDSLAGFSDKRIVWDYGDGTRQEAITGQHVYTTPGTYKIKSYLYDKFGNGYYNTFSVTVNIYDFVEDRLEIGTVNAISHNTGEIKNPISISQFNSARSFERNSGPAPIKLYADSNNDINYDYFETENSEKAYGHLLPSHTFIQKINNVENVPIDVLKAEEYTSIYAKVSGNEDTGSILVTAFEPGEDTVFAGISCKNDVYFRSDVPGGYDLNMGFEDESVFSYTNTTTYGVGAEILQNNDYNSLTVTSNGLDGEDVVTFDKFDINPIKFSCTKISFVVRAKDGEGFSHRHIPLIELCPLPNTGHMSLTAVLTDGENVYDAEFYNDFSSVSADLPPGDFLIPGDFTGYRGGFFKGYLTIDTDEILKDVWIEAYTEYQGNSLSGASNKFSIYPEEYYTVAKKGEDVDFTDIFKDVALQPLFTDSKILMNDFFGAIFGSIESAQDSIGKSTYEKIENFLDNNSTIDYANIDQLASILQLLDLPSINKYSLPPKIKRLMDLLSISQSRLFGDINHNREDFNSFGYLNTETYGFDRCEPIPTDGVVFTYAGFDIVAFEKYSGRWVTLNTMLPLSASNPPPVRNLVIDPNPIENEGYFTCLVGDLSCTPIMTETLTAINVENGYFHICIEDSFAIGSDDRLLLETEYYSLSDYNESWGWPITLDKDGTLFDVYDFFYKKRYDITDVENSVINFDDKNTTIEKDYTYSEWSRPNGVMSNIFSNALYDGLGLVDCQLSVPLSAIVTKEMVSTGDINSTTYTQGELITYRVEIENPNEVDITNVKLIESLPGAPGSILNAQGNTELLDGLGYVPAKKNGVNGTAYLEYSYKPSDSDIYDFNQISPESIYTISNIAAFTSKELKCPAISNPIDVNVYIPPRDLIVTKSVAELDQYAVGAPVTYTIAIENTNFVNITATLTDSLPGAPGTLINRSGETELFSLTGAVLPPRSTTTVSYDYIPTTSDIGELTNIATVSSSLPDAISNEVVVNIAPLNGLILDKRVESGSGPYQGGDTINYKVFVTNPNDIAVTNAQLTDSLTTITNIQGASELFTSSLEIPAGDTVEVTYDYVVTGNDTFTDTLINSVTASGDSVDNTITSESVAIDPLLALEVNKSVPSFQVAYQVGDPIGYEVVVTNPNGVAVNNVQLVDSLSPLQSQAGAIDLLSGTTIPANSSKTLTYEYVPTTTGSVINTVTVTSDLAQDSSDTNTVSVFTPGALEVTKTITTGAGPYEFGDTITYRINITNPNPITVEGVKIEESLSPVTATGGNAGLLGAGINIPANGSVFVQYNYTVPVVGSEVTTLVNTATATATGPSELSLDPVIVTATALIDENRWDFVAIEFDNKDKNWEG